MVGLIIEYVYVTVKWGVSGLQCYCDMQIVWLLEYRWVSTVKGAVCANRYGLAPLDKLRAQTEEGKHKIKQ